MLRKKQVITMVSIAVISFLVGTTFNALTMAKEGGNPFDRIWTVISELQSNVGRVEDDVSELRSKVDTLNTSYLDLLDRVEMVENQMLPPGFITAPAYDSGWANISQGKGIIFNHNLDTKELLVFVLGKDNLGSIHHRMYGSVEWSGGLWQGIWWNIPNDSQILVRRLPEDNHWFEVRVMLWKIQD